MLPFHVPDIRTDDDSGLVPVLNPVHDAQHDTVVCLVGPIGTPTKEDTLTDLPRSWPPEAVSHSGYHEQPPKRVHLGCPPFGCTKKEYRSQKAVSPQPLVLQQNSRERESEAERSS